MNAPNIAAPRSAARVRAYIRLSHNEGKDSAMGLRINDTAPDFTAESTEGTIRFHEWVGDGYHRAGYVCPAACLCRAR